MSKAFYLRLATQNIRRGRAVFLPQLIATAVISGVYFLINGLTYSDGLMNVPAGATAQMVFMLGIVVFSIFAFFFMFYINSFLIKRRKKEFGLYAVLGMNKRQIGRVLFYENLLTTLLGLLIGIIVALVFGNLLFLLLLKLIRAVGDSHFSIGWQAYAITLGLFALIFVVNTIYNTLSVQLANPISLLHSEKKGDKDSKLVYPVGMLGILLLGAAYYFAWSINVSGMAIGLFFPLALLVIIATYLLFESGSIAILKTLRAKKNYYYKTEHFITLGGLIHRMRQNARGLASICILSTMFVVTVSGTLSLYLGQEQMLKQLNPYDVAVYNTHGGDKAINDADAALAALNARAAEYGVVMQPNEEKIKYVTREEYKGDRLQYNEDSMLPGFRAEVRQNAVLVFYQDDEGERFERFMFDLEGPDDKCMALCKALRQSDGLSVSDIFSSRQEGYGVYGGLLFLGAFFGILFLSITVLIIYFKQISEGYEDKARFEILQKVGMDQKMVKKTIDSQVLFVFFTPLLMTLVHMLFASRIMTQMLQAFKLSDWVLVLCCVAGICALFALLYLVVYRLTARAYYKIVKREA